MLYSYTVCAGVHTFFLQPLLDFHLKGNKIMLQFINYSESSPIIIIVIFVGANFRINYSFL